MGSWKAALGASAVLAAGAGALAVPAAGATVSPVERASATAVAILSPAGHAAGGIPTLFAWEAPVHLRGYRFPDDGSLLRIGHVTASAERGSGDEVGATGSVVLRSARPGSIFGRVAMSIVGRSPLTIRRTTHIASGKPQLRPPRALV